MLSPLLLYPGSTLLFLTTRRNQHAGVYAFQQEQENTVSARTSPLTEKRFGSLRYAQIELVTITTESTKV